MDGHENDSRDRSNDGRSLTRRATLGLLGLGFLGGGSYLATRMGGPDDSWLPNSIEYALSNRVR